MNLAWIAAASLLLAAGSSSAGAQPAVPAPPPAVPAPTAVPSDSPAAVPDAGACVLAPFSAPKKLEFSRLTRESTAGTQQYHIHIAYDFGSLPVYADGLGRVPNSGVLRFAMPDAVLTFRCRDEDGPVLAALDLAQEMDRMRTRAAVTAGSTAMLLSSAQAAYVLRDTPSALQKISTITAQSSPSPQKAEAFLLLGKLKAANGDASGANGAWFTAKRLAKSTPNWGDLSARTDLASYSFDVSQGRLDDAQRVASAIDSSRLFDASTRQQVDAVKTFGTVLTGVGVGDPWADLTGALGDDLDNETESAVPPFERAFKAPWTRGPQEFLSLMQPVFDAVFHTNDFETSPCPPASPKLHCALSRARQLNHFDAAGHLANFNGWVARIKFRTVRWDTDAEGPNKAVYVDVQYAVSERLVGQTSDPWEPVKTANHGVESAIENDARRVAAALNKQIAKLQKQRASNALQAWAP